MTQWIGQASGASLDTKIMNAVEEKLAQFIGKQPISATFEDGTLTLEFDDDGDSNTDGTLTLTIFNVAGLDGIRVD